MNTNYMLAAAAIVALAPAGAALAEDFDGPYIGVQAGFEQSEAENPTTELGVLAYDDDVQSVASGLFAGYDTQITPRVVLGVEGGFDFPSGSDTMHGLIGGRSASIDRDWSLSLTARAGYKLDPSSLVYVRGGYENEQVEVTALNSAGAQNSYSETRDGWTVGAGYERQLMENVYGRIEYRYSDPSEGDGSWGRRRVLAGVSYRF